MGKDLSYCYLFAFSTNEAEYLSCASSSVNCISTIFVRFSMGTFYFFLRIVKIFHIIYIIMRALIIISVQHRVPELKEAEAVEFQFSSFAFLFEEIIMKRRKKGSHMPHFSLVTASGLGVRFLNAQHTSYADNFELVFLLHLVT